MPRRSRALLAFLLAVVAGVTGCTPRTPAPDPTPSVVRVLATAEDALRRVQTVWVDLEVSGGDRQVWYDVTATTTRDRKAKGTWQVLLPSPGLADDFVLVDGTIYTRPRSSDDRWNRVPVADRAAFYDPGQLLDPQRGLVNVLATADPHLLGADGDTYLVSILPDRDALHALIPAFGGQRPSGQLKIDVRTGRLTELDIASQNSAGAGDSTVTLRLDKYDVPADISAPS